MKTKAISDFRVTLERDDTMKNQMFRSALMLAVVSFPAIASAGETIPQDGIWSKVGLGAASTMYTSTEIYYGSSIEHAKVGGAPELRAAVGAVISPGSVIHASLGFNRLAEPELKDTAGGKEATAPSTDTLSLISACAGLTRYFGAASITARAGYATQSGDGQGDATGWISGAGLDYDFSSSESSRFGVGLNMDFAGLESEGGTSVTYGSLGLFLNGTFY